MDYFMQHLEKHASDTEEEKAEKEESCKTLADLTNHVLVETVRDKTLVIEKGNYR